MDYAESLRHGLGLLAKQGRDASLITALGDNYLLVKKVGSALACYFCALKYDPSFQLAKKKLVELQHVAHSLYGIPWYEMTFDMEKIWDDTAEKYDQLVARNMGSMHRTAQMELIGEHIRNLQATRVLMPCCGVGSELFILHRLDPHLQLTGLDRSENLLRMARHRNPHGIRFVHGNAAHLPFADRSFNVGVTVGGLMSLENPHGVLSEMRRTCTMHLFIVESSLEHIPSHDLKRANLLINPAIWMHHYERLFAQQRLRILHVTDFPADYLTCFEVAP